MKLVSTKNKTVGQTYIVRATSAYILTVRWENEEATIAEEFDHKLTGMTPQAVRGLQTKLDNGAAVFVTTCVECTNTKTGAVGTAYLGGTYDDSIDAIWSNAISGYYMDMLEEAMQDAGINQE